MMCETCKSQKAKVVFTHEDEQKGFCIDCYNNRLSKKLNIKLQSHSKDVSIPNYAGVSREFTITQRLDPVGIFMEATEKKEYGYKFAVHGELSCDQSDLFQQLLDKVKQGITRPLKNPFSRFGEDQ